MESYEASKAVFTRVQNIDPENASKIMGYILLHHNDKDMLHLAYGHETLLISLINRAFSHLGISSNTLSASNISSPISISRPNPLNLSLSLPVLSNGFDSNSPSDPSIWSPNHISLSPNFNNNNNNNNNGNNINFMESSFIDDFKLKDKNFSKNVDFNEQNIDFFNENSNGKVFNEMGYYGSDDSSNGFGIKPCLYYSRGFCKNGSNCNFVHGENDININNNNSNNYDFELCQDEIFRSKMAHQHRLAAQLMANGVNLPFNKLNFLHSEAQRSAAALMMSDDFHKLNRLRMARNEFAGLDCNPSSRQIYLTFPADSTFKEEDVSNYFNKFGPVQDVRIPYQQKRMFGFVTFVFPETVKIILAKGNPHFVCESRVLVKPYKEKGKLPDKKQHPHQFERGEFSCSSPSGHECMEPYDFPLGGRMMYSTQEMLLRKKLEEQADLHHVLELQERRLMNLQLLDMKNQHHHHPSIGSPIQSPNISSQFPINHTAQDTSEEKKDGPTVGDDELNDSNGIVLKKEGNPPNREEIEFFESLDHVLPENLFASPTKSSSKIRPASFSPALAELEKDSSPSTESLPTPSPLSKAPLKSCFFEMPRISNGHGALGM